MKSLKSLLKQKGPDKNIIKKTALSDKDIFFIFNKTIKEEFGSVGAGNLKPDYFNQKTIFVKTQSSNWASELWLNRKNIIRKINKELGEGAIQEIKIK